MAEQQETKGDKFRRIATRRTNQVLHEIRKLANLANLYAYDFDRDEVNRVFDTIERSVRLARGKFDAELEFRDRPTTFDLE